MTLLDWIVTKIWWSVLKGLSTVGVDWARKKLMNKIEKEIEVDNKGELNFLTETSFPAAWLKFKVISKAEVDLTPKHIIAWAIWCGAAIDKICWSKQENIFEREQSSAVRVLTGSTTYHSIPKLPIKENRYFGLYYPLPPHVDFGKHGLGLHGIIEFDCSFGTTVVKEFEVNFKISEDKWKEALDIWTDSLKGKRTIISSIANLK